MMEQIDMTKYLPCTARLVGGTLYILDGEGRVQRRLDPLQTAIEWFQMSNDAFYARYGVNWIPKEPYYSQARRMVHKQRVDMQNKDVVTAALDEVQASVFSALAQEQPELYRQVAKFIERKKKEGL